LILDGRDMQTILGGNMRLLAMKELKWAKVSVSVVFPVDEKDAIEIALEDNDRFGKYVMSQVIELVQEFHIDTRINVESKIQTIADIMNEEGEEIRNRAEDFGVPPFSVLDTRQGYWQERKRNWISKGIKSEIGRDEFYSGLGDLQNKKNASIKGNFNASTSIFVPVLCEIMYKWFNVEMGEILDPFAGGSVRGVVACMLGYKYTGIDLSARQIEENNKQAEAIGVTPNYIIGDSNLMIEKLPDNYCDMVFTCPPYEDLEVYSKDSDDLSNMNHEEFNRAYFSIIEKTYKKLKDNSFAVIVVGEARSKAGSYYNFVGNTIQAFISAGYKYYNEIILVNAVGTLPFRAGRIMNKSRKVGKVHQNVLVFYKGVMSEIASKYGSIAGISAIDLG